MLSPGGPRVIVPSKQSTIGLIGAACGTASGTLSREGEKPNLSSYNTAGRKSIPACGAKGRKDELQLVVAQTNNHIRCTYAWQPF
jgi:hypothetical protein